MPIPRSSALYLAYDPLFLLHRSRGYHPERPERLAAARRGVDRVEAEGARVIPLPERDATDAEILRAHELAYLAELDPPRRPPRRARRGHLPRPRLRRRRPPRRRRSDRARRRRCSRPARAIRGRASRCSVRPATTRRAIRGWASAS